MPMQPKPTSSCRCTVPPRCGTWAEQPLPQVWGEAIVGKYMKLPDQRTEGLGQKSLDIWSPGHEQEAGSCLSEECRPGTVD